MARTVSGIALRHIRRLFDGGSVAGLTDATLIRRFAADRDEDAFAALIDRHGPMVLGVCRAVLRDDAHAAEDAFQRTFLILARRSGTIRVSGDSIAGYLHTVAHREALRLGRDDARRRLRERLAAGEAARRGATPDPDLIAAVHRAVAALPDRLRLPVVLCHLEGRTHAQAAAELRWGEATLRRRLADARDLLRSRMLRDGIAPAAALVVLLQPGRATAAEAAARAPQLARRAAELATVGLASTLAAAASAVAGRLLAMGAAARSNGLATAAVALVVACPFSPGSATGGGASQPRGTPVATAPAAAPRTTPAAPPAPDDGRPADRVAIAGRVVGPDGLPVGGAEVTLFQGGAPDADFPPIADRARSGPDGTFRLDVDREALRGLDAGEDVPADHPILAAVADGFGPAWASADGPEALDGLTLRLVPDDVPIAGRVLDLEGRPVPGAVIRPSAIMAAEGEDLDAVLRAGDGGDPRRLIRSPYLDARVARLPREVVSDEDGRFTLAGVGRGRILRFTVAAGTIATEQLLAMTRPGPPAVVRGLYGPGDRDETVLGASFEHAAAPSVPVEGVVRDAETGLPVAGVLLRGRGGDVLAEARSDAEGRYRLLGVPRLETYRVAALPGDAPFVGASSEARGGPGLGPVTIDFDLLPGVVVRGRLAEAGTGAPVRGEVTYLPYRDNPAAEALTGMEPGNRWVQWNLAATGRDGRFTLVVPPGHGLLAARSASRRYAPGHGLGRLTGLDASGSVPTAPEPFWAALCESVLELELPPGGSPDPIAMEFDPGTPLRGVVVGPDGRPVPHASVSVREGGRSRHHASADAEGRFRLALPGTMAEAGVLVVAMADGLAPGLDQISPRDVAGGGERTVRLRPDDVPIVGRVLDLEGRPVAGAAVRPQWVREAEDGDLDAWLDVARSGRAGATELESRLLPIRVQARDLGLPEALTTDADGRFRIEGVGRDRLVELEILGPSIRYADTRVATRAFDPFDLPKAAGSTDWGVVPYYGATFEHVASPGRPIEGVVKDIDTGAPIPGVEIRSYQFAEFPVINETQLVATSDADGRYRLEGMSPGPGNRIVARPPADSPYVSSVVEVEDGGRPGLEAVATDIPLKRGIWIEGRVTDAETGAPVRDGSAFYGIFRDDPHYRQCPGLDGDQHNATFPIAQDGSFRVRGLPGRGVVAVAWAPSGYPSLMDRPGGPGKFEYLDVAPGWMHPGNFNEVVEVDIPEGADPFRCDLALTPGRALAVTVLDPDGRPLPGARLASDVSGWTVPWSEGSFSLPGMPTSGRRTFRFRHDGRGLVGLFRVDLAGGEPLVARLEPWGVATGRLVDEDGRPRGGVRLHIEAMQGDEEIGTIGGHGFGEQPETDADGRFRVEGLIPGLAHKIWAMEHELDIGGVVASGIEAGPGESRELGEVIEEQDR